MSTMPTRIDEDLFEAARAVGARMSRSAAQQISHWARLGRELEASSGMSSQAISRVLAGQQPYDTLTDQEQAAVRSAWDDAVQESVASLDLAAERAAAGESWTELDDDGNVVTRTAADLAG